MLLIPFCLCCLLRSSRLAVKMDWRFCTFFLFFWTLFLTHDWVSEISRLPHVWSSQYATCFRYLLSFFAPQLCLFHERGVLLNELSCHIKNLFSNHAFSCHRYKPSKMLRHLSGRPLAIRGIFFPTLCNAQQWVQRNGARYSAMFFTTVPNVLKGKGKSALTSFQLPRWIYRDNRRYNARCI